MDKIKIGTINLDWCLKSRVKLDFIKDVLNGQSFDFLIVTENIKEFEYPSSQYYAYHSSPIPSDREYEYLDYGKYLKGKTPVRTSIYTLYNSTNRYEVIDSKTSIAQSFHVKGLEFILYGSIIGTWGLKFQEELAQKEFDNFKADIKYLKTINQRIIIAGDLNTSFLTSEKSKQLLIIQSRNRLNEFFTKESLHISTKNIPENIDHIIVSDTICQKYKIHSHEFIGSETLYDTCHKGVSIELIQRSSLS